MYIKKIPVNPDIIPIINPKRSSAILWISSIYLDHPITGANISSKKKLMLYINERNTTPETKLLSWMLGFRNILPITSDTACIRYIKCRASKGLLSRK